MFRGSTFPTFLLLLNKRSFLTSAVRYNSEREAGLLGRAKGWFLEKRKAHLQENMALEEERQKQASHWNPDNPYDEKELDKMDSTRLEIEAAKQALEAFDRDKKKAQMLGDGSGSVKKFYANRSTRQVTGGLAEGQPKQDIVSFYGEPKTRFYVESWMHSHEALRNYSMENRLAQSSVKAKEAFSSMIVKSLDTTYTMQGGINDASAHTWESLGGWPKTQLTVNFIYPGFYNPKVLYLATASLCAPFIVAPGFALLSDYAFYESIVKAVAAGSFMYLTAFGSLNFLLSFLSVDGVNNARRQAVAVLHFIPVFIGLAMPYDEIALWIAAVSFYYLPRYDCSYIGQILPKTFRKCRLFLANIVVASIIFTLYAIPTILQWLDRDMMPLEEKRLAQMEKVKRLDERRNRVLAMVQEIRKENALKNTE